MIFHTFEEAYQSPSPAPSWQTRSILRIELQNRRVFWKVVVFDHYRDKCKRCRHALRKNHQNGWRMACTSYTCTICGNPYAATVRQARSKRWQEKWETLKDVWVNSGKLH